MDLKGKVAIVTGVTKGIGKATVEQLLTKGCKVVGLGRTNTLPETENYRFIACDVRKYDQVEAAISAAQSAFGQQVHILINNAGLGYFGKIESSCYRFFLMYLRTLFIVNEILVRGIPVSLLRLE